MGENAQPSFNLVDEPFIPCIRPDGRREEFSLRDTLAEAHEIREIRDDSPLVTIALHRLLLAVLHRNFGPESIDAWAKLWGKKRFDAKILDDYFGKWHDRFDLCDDKYPFYQTPGLPEDKAVSLWRLAMVQANNATLFDHRTEHETPSLAPGEAARLLIAYQAFAVGGGVSKPFNLMHGPLTREKGFLCLITGENLFETLWLNTAPPSFRPEIPSSPADRPCWEVETPEKPRKSGTIPGGYLDYLTWQSRRIALLPDYGAVLRFSRMVMLQGFCLSNGIDLIEPMATYEQSKDGAYRAKPFREGRSLWRDSHTLLEPGGKTTRPPCAVRFLAELKSGGSLSDDTVFGLAAIGLCSDRAKITFWRHETMPLPLAYLGDEELLSSLRGAIENAENACKVLKDAIWALVKLACQLPGGNADKDRVAQFRDSLAPEPKYWARLEQPFRTFLLNLPGDTKHQFDCLDDWTKSVCREAREVFSQIVAGLDSSPRMLRAIYQTTGRNWGAQKTLNIRLAEITKNMQENDHDTVQAE